jgi:hypothetical protein
MGVPTSEVGYASATTRRGDHKVYKGHVVVLGGREIFCRLTSLHPDGVKVNWSPTRCENASLLRIIVLLVNTQCKLFSPSYLNIPAFIVSLKI